MIAKFYRAPDGTEPVADFIDGLPVEARASVAFSIELLNELTDEHPYIPFPHSSQVERELRELRCHHGRQLYRILYRRSEKLHRLAPYLPQSDSHRARSGKAGRPRAVGRLQDAHGRAITDTASATRERCPLTHCTHFALLKYALNNLANFGKIVPS